MILAGLARAGLQQLQAAVQLRWYSVLIAVRLCLIPGEAAPHWRNRGGGRGQPGLLVTAAAAGAESSAAAPAAAAAAPQAETRRTLCK